VVNIFPRLTVFENVQIAILSRERRTYRIFSAVKGMAADEVHSILRSVGLYDRRDVESDLLSHGDQKVLEIAVALGGDRSSSSSMSPRPGWRRRRRSGASA